MLVASTCFYFDDQSCTQKEVLARLFSLIGFVSYFEQFCPHLSGLQLAYGACFGLSVAHLPECGCSLNNNCKAQLINAYGSRISSITDDIERSCLYYSKAGDLGCYRQLLVQKAPGQALSLCSFCVSLIEADDV
jgi:hypothetical protein